MSYLSIDNEQKLVLIEDKPCSTKSDRTEPPKVKKISLENMTNYSPIYWQRATAHFDWQMIACHGI